MNAPLSNINGSLVNVDSSNYNGGNFTSRIIPSSVNPNVLPEPLNNIQAANAYIPCLMKGGKKKKTKIKNIRTMYKMRNYKKSVKKTLSRKIQRKNKTKHRRRNRRLSRKRQRGGYAQYQNNLPLTQTYSLGGKLDPTMSALANPPPQTVLSNCTNCVDNYSYFSNAGFPSKGWW
jgi:hypothetical protein